VSDGAAIMLALATAAGALVSSPVPLPAALGVLVVAFARRAPVLLWMAGTDALCTFFNQTWLDFTDLVFVDPVGTGWSRVIEPEKKGDDKDAKSSDDALDPKEYFGYKRDLESLCEFMGPWLSENGRWGSPVSIPGWR